MDYYNMSVNQLVAECKRLRKELDITKTKVSVIEKLTENIRILGRQNKKLKRDNERYRRILDKNPKTIKENTDL